MSSCLHRLLPSPRPTTVTSHLEILKNTTAFSHADDAYLYYAPIHHQGKNLLIAPVVIHTPESVLNLVCMFTNVCFNRPIIFGRSFLDFCKACEVKTCLSVLQHFWVGSIACKNCPINDLLCVGWDTKPCTRVPVSLSATLIAFVTYLWMITPGKRIECRMELGVRAAAACPLRLVLGSNHAGRGGREARRAGGRNVSRPR